MGLDPRRQSSASQSDWQIVREFFTRNSGDYRKMMHLPNSNPEVRNRINAVNALICSATRERRLVVSPRCKQLIRDLEQVVWKTDANGNALGVVDNSDKMRTHLSDALGYLVVKKYALAPKIGLRRGSIY